MISHCQRRHKNIDLSKIILTFSVFAFLFSLGYRIHSAGRLAVKNETLKVYSEKKAILEKEVALLEYEDSKYSSLKYLETAATSLGLVRATEPLLAVEFTGGSSIAAAR